ncbi:MAG: 6-phosphofructokinase [Planctomycetota bacterium]|nr:6-phosphofructokinase [Planctomycetota bacterium]
MTSKPLSGNAVIGQSGGPTAVINQSLVGAIEKLAPCRQIKRLLGAHHGVRGIVKEDFLDLRKIKRDVLERVAQTPAAALGSSRDKPDEAYCEKIFKSFAKFDVRYFFYIGGNDSADTARIIHEMAAATRYELRTFHIPKTIDNDLRVTDHCPGYGSAARYVASAFAGDDRDNASLPGVKINVVMGRHAGWLTAAAGLARQDDADGPHLVYVPEVVCHLVDKFVEDVARIYDRFGRCQIAVSEGVQDETHTPVVVALAERLGHRVERDSHGNPQLSGTGALGDFLGDYLKQKLGEGKKSFRVRADTLGYPQRSFAGYASSVDQAEARLAGRTAAEYALEGTLDGSVAFKRAAGRYRVTCFRAELKDVARKTKDLPRNFINRPGNGVTDAFYKYALPLVGELPVIGKLF